MLRFWCDWIIYAVDNKIDSYELSGMIKPVKKIKRTIVKPVKKIKRTIVKVSHCIREG